MPHNKSIEELNFINIDEDTVSLSIIEKNDEKKLNILEFANLLDKIAIYYPNLKKLIISNIANVTSKNSGLALSPLEKIENETYQTNLIYLLIDGLSKLQNLEFLEIDSCFLDREENKINKINKAFLPENLNQSKLKFLSLKKTCLNTFDIIPLILFNSGLRELHLLDVNIDYKFNKLTLAINEHSNVKKFKLNLPDYFMQNPRNISSLEDLTNLACLDIANISCLNEVEFKQLYTSVFSLKNLKSLTLCNFSLLNYEPTIIEIKDFCEN